MIDVNAQTHTHTHALHCTLNLRMTFTHDTSTLTVITLRASVQKCLSQQPDHTESHTLCVCYVYTLYNLFAHSSCTLLLILLFIKSTVYCPAHLILEHILFFFIFYYNFFNLCLYIFSCVVLHILHCPLSGPDLTLHFTTDYILYNWVCDE